MNQLLYWPRLRELPLQFLVNVRQFMSLGHKGGCLLLILKDDTVYGYGDDHDGVLGLGSKWANIKEPMELIELRNKEIVEMVRGTEHVVALTRKGRVWSWGQNQNGQLGIDGSMQECLRPKQIEADWFENEPVVTIKGDDHYNMALTRKGRVFQWGWINDLTKQATPILVEDIDDFQIVQIACSYSHSMALTSTRSVYVWGSNCNGKLGIGTFDHQILPVPLFEDMKNFRIKQIACGSEHSLLLTEQGHCYCFGSNSSGQLGNVTAAAEANKPQIVAPRFQNRDSTFVQHRFRTIGACGRLSVAISAEDELCYVWGQLSSDNLCTRKPTKTPLVTLDSVFGFYSTSQNTSGLVQFEGYKNINQSVLRLARLFDNEESADLEIHVDHRVIHVHRAFLMANSEHFRTILSEPPPRDCSVDGPLSSTISTQIDRSPPRTDYRTISTRLSITDYSYPVYYAYLQYLYTNRTSPSLDHSQFIQLLHLSLVYSETEILHHCIDQLVKNLSVENCCHLYQLAVDHELYEFQQSVVLFFSKKVSQVYKSQAFRSMNDRLCKRLALDYAKLIVD